MFNFILSIRWFIFFSRGAVILLENILLPLTDIGAVWCIGFIQSIGCFIAFISWFLIRVKLFFRSNDLDLILFWWRWHCLESILIYFIISILFFFARCCLYFIIYTVFVFNFATFKLISIGRRMFKLSGLVLHINKSIILFLYYILTVKKINK